jgi:plasmid maintenance system antidote protein VapI
MMLKKYGFRTSDDEIMDALEKIIVAGEFTITTLAVDMRVSRPSIDKFLKCERKLQINTRIRVCDYINKYLANMGDSGV